MKRRFLFLLVLAALTAPVTGSASPGPRPQEEEFVPSERIRADAAVSFPVDI
jgi:hypothetical protein